MSTKKHQKIGKIPGGGLRKNTEILKNHRGGLRKSQHLAEFQANILGKKSWGRSTKKKQEIWKKNLRGIKFRNFRNLLLVDVYEKANTWPNFRPTFWAKNLGQHSSQKFWSKKSFSKMKAKEWANKN